MNVPPGQFSTHAIPDLKLKQFWHNKRPGPKQPTHSKWQLGQSNLLLETITSLSVLSCQFIVSTKHNPVVLSSSLLLYFIVIP